MNDLFDGNYAAIPADMQGALIRYVDHGIDPGGFLGSVIDNDLEESIGRADQRNLPLIPVYVTWLVNRAPAGCHGSREKRIVWMISFTKSNLMYPTRQQSRILEDGMYQLFDSIEEFKKQEG